MKIIYKYNGYILFNNFAYTLQFIKSFTYNLKLHIKMCKFWKKDNTFFEQNDNICLLLLKLDKARK